VSETGLRALPPPLVVASLSGLTHPPPDGPTMQLELSTEKLALAATETHSTLAMASITAPGANAGERLPIEIVAVVDRSGSMSGPKMTWMKETLTFLVKKGMSADDRLAIVTFHDEVATPLPITTMSADGRRKALDVVDKIKVGGITNLSGGILEGIDLLACSQSSTINSTRAVLVFTDGQANAGISDSDGILEAVRGALSASPTTIFTFGFGSDHNENLLRGMAEQCNGLYYFIDSAEGIPQAFTDCLGGLVSVVSQNVSLTFLSDNGATLGQLHGAHSGVDASNDRIRIVLGDMYANEEKDILVNIQLPALPEPLETESNTVFLNARLRYFSIQDNAIREIGSSLAFSRPNMTPSDQPPNIRLDEHRNRVDAAIAMDKAAKLADEGDVLAGQQLLRSVAAQARCTPSAESPMVSALCTELEDVAKAYSSQTSYTSFGSKMSKMAAMSHHQQRSNHITGAAYEKQSKREYKGVSGFFR